VASCYPRWSGDHIVPFLGSLGRALVEAGCEVDVLTPSDGKDASSLPAHERLEGVDVHRYSYFWPRRLERVAYGRGIPSNVRQSWLAKLQVPGFVLCQLGALLRLVRRRRYDVINSHWLLAQGVTCSLVSQLMGVPHVATVHAAGIFALRRMPFGRACARYIARHTDHFFLVSSLYVEMLRSMGVTELPSTVLPMGVDYERFAGAGGGEDVIERLAVRGKRVILFVGRLEEKKGVSFLAEAYQYLQAGNPDVHLIVIGSGTCEAALRQHVEQHGYGDRVTLCGRVPHEDIPSYYRAADVVVCPSVVDSSGETEGMPVVLLEAMASGRPVVATRVSGIPDVVEDGVNGLLVEPADAGALHDALGRVFEPGAIERLRSGAIATAKQYDWGRVAAQYADTFEQVARARADRRRRTDHAE
jgi:glycosyltransferase involved in cell wall biosynthesis